MKRFVFIATVGTILAFASNSVIGNETTKLTQQNQKMKKELGIQ